MIFFNRLDNKMEAGMWYQDLCEYYGVSEETAIELGTRKSGRRPSLPSSPTCKSVSGKSFEELWDEKPRDTIQQKMDFYKDIGAWQVFRQCNYRHNFNYSSLIYSQLKNGASLVEYGCGVAPLTNYIIENPQNFDIKSMKFSLVDVSGEHLEFAKWRLKKKAPDVDFDFHEITSDYSIPLFNRKFDIICIMDVLEHLPNPYVVMQYLCEQANPNAILVETWINKDHDAGGPDLQEAQDQRANTMELINANFDLLKKGSIRVRRKKG